ncbi:MAG: hypothetical protein IJD97_00705 [Clostridia bacterium]|nr:hypothetical protein [Clostridia bacterium]
MKKQQLILHKTESGNYRSVIKTKHGRLIYLEIREGKNSLSVINCFYLDRIRSGSGEYYSSPQKLVTREFSYNEMLDVIASELDRKYFGVEITDKFADLTNDEFIELQLKAMQRKYNFLIFVAEGELIDGIPSVIKTRFKNRIHRGIYLEMQYRNGKGVITDCHYYDRKYKERSKVVPEMLSSVFFEYNRQAILHIVNNELNTAFNHIIFVTDGSLDIDNEIALCGNI